MTGILQQVFRAALMHEDDARYLCIFVSSFLGSSSAAYRPFFIIV